MGLADHLSAGIAELHSFCATVDQCAVLGRSFRPVRGRRSYDKTPADAGFLDGITAAFDALNSDIAGLSKRRAVGQILTFRSEKYVIVSFDEGELTTTFNCRAKNA